jgi:hypothetical protein
MFAVSIAGALFFASADTSAGDDDGMAVIAPSGPEFEYSAGDRRGAGTFSALARSARRLPIHWSYRGRRDQVRERVRLERFVVRGDIEIFHETLAEASPPSRFRSPASPFSYSGTSTFDLRPGDVYGFRIVSGVFEVETRLQPRGCRWSIPAS